MCGRPTLCPGLGVAPGPKSKKYWDSGFAFKDLQAPKQQDTCEKFNNNTRHGGNAIRR